MPKSHAQTQRELRVLRASFREFTASFPRLGAVLAAHAEKASGDTVDITGRRKPCPSMKQVHGRDEATAAGSACKGQEGLRREADPGGDPGGGADGRVVA